MKKQYVLGRSAPHRKALLKNLSKHLIQHKHLITTLQKAKYLRPFIEPLLTKSKRPDTHHRRQVFQHLQDKQVVKMLFDEIAPRIADRNGGYTRIVKLPPRQGDNAKMAFIELVDFGQKSENTAS